MNKIISFTLKVLNTEKIEAALKRIGQLPGVVSTEPLLHPALQNSNIGRKYQLNVDASTLGQALERLQQDPDVESVKPPGGQPIGF